MNKNEGIIMFTKNRPEILKKTLPQLTDGDLPIIVLDDSTNTKTRKTVNNWAEKVNNIYYHGRNEQKELLKKFAKLGSDLDYFIKTLGTNGWNLGYVRNYAIILAKILGFERVLFIDDDIIIKDHNIIQDMMRLLNDMDFVGAKIIGMPDYSVVNHIERELGMKPYEFLSGGFLAFNQSSVSEYFLNYYNEDWIWLFLHKPKAKFIKYGEGHQLPFDPFENAVEKALRQEFGVILVRGVKEAVESENYALLLNKHFWSRIIEGRSAFIKDITNLSKKNCVIGISVGRFLLSYLLKIDEEKFVNIFTTYYKRKKLWGRLLYDLGEYKNRGFLWRNAYEKRS
jgi:hypothetical protein